MNKKETISAAYIISRCGISKINQNANRVRKVWNWNSIIILYSIWDITNANFRW